MVEQDKNDEWLKMQEVQDMLTRAGFNCASRRSFYKRLNEWKIPYKELNPGGIKKNRRFRKSDIEKLIEDPEYFIKQAKQS